MFLYIVCGNINNSKVTMLYLTYKFKALRNHVIYLEDQYMLPTLDTEGAIQSVYGVSFSNITAKNSRSIGFLLINVQN